MNDLKSLKRIIRFFSRPDECGYGFCVAKDQRQIPKINQQIHENSKRVVKIVQLTASSSIIDQLKKVIRQYDTALIVNHLDLLTQRNYEKLQELNFSREALHRLNSPIIFWITEPLLGKIANHAADLFSQRQISTLYFSATNSITLPKNLTTNTTNQEAPKTTNEIEKLLLRATTLEQQLQTALQNQVPKQQIANELVLPLATVRNDLYQHNKATDLLKEWAAYFDDQDPNTNLQIGIIWETTAKVEIALKYYQAAQITYEKQRNIDKINNHIKYQLGIVYSRLGGVYTTLGNLNKALDFFEKDAQLTKELLNLGNIIKKQMLQYKHDCIFTKQKNT